MKKVAIGLSLVSAAALLAGIFLPWIHYQSGSIGGFSISYSLSGWGVFHDTSWFDNIALGALKVDSDVHALIVFIASIVMLLCALAAFVLSLKSKGDNAGIGALGIIISLAAVVAIGGLAWFLADMSSVDNWSDYIGAGIYVCGAGAVLGLVGGILASVKGSSRSIPGSEQA